MWIQILLIYSIFISIICAFFLYKLNHKQSQSNSNNSVESLTLLLMNFPACGLIMNHLGNILFVNDYFLSHSGYTSEEILDQKISNFLVSTTTNSIVNDLWKTLNNQQVWCGPFVNITKTGEVCTEEFLVFPVQENNGDFFYCAMGHNVANHYIKNLQAEALQKQSIYLKENFINNLSHEIRTPLNALLGLSQLGVNCNDLSKCQRYFSKLNISSKQLMNLMDDMLDFSKISSGHFTFDKSRINLLSLLSALTRQYEPLACEKNLEFHFSIEGTIPQTLFCDPFRVEQILSQLLRNAINHTRFGSVSLRVSMEKQPNLSCYLSFEIADCGVAMDSLHVDGMFNPFTHLVSDEQNKSNQSFGLNIAITKQLVDLMGGSILVKNSPNVGTTMTVILPFAEEDYELTNLANPLPNEPSQADHLIHSAITSAEMDPLITPSTINKEDQTALIEALKELLSQTNLRKPKGCKEALSVFRDKAPKHEKIIALIDQFQLELSQYHFSQMAELIQSISIELGGILQNEISRNV